jgi:hypothetical protein
MFSMYSIFWVFVDALRGLASSRARPTDLSPGAGVYRSQTGLRGVAIGLGSFCGAGRRRRDRLFVRCGFVRGGELEPVCLRN